MRAVLAVLCVWVTALCFAAPATAWAGPPPFDPKQMSGIPRPDPEVSAGTITVRVLGEGGFSDPAVNQSVTLQVTGPDGTQESLQATTQQQGRATFEGLQRFAGGKAVASVELGGQTLESLPIDVLPSTGSRVMLVQGAPQRPAPANTPARHGQPGGPDVPAPGVPFPMDGLPKGSLTIGTFDLQARRPVSGIDVELTITPPQGEPIVRTGKTDEQGKAVFQNLLPPTVPEGSTFTVRGGGQQVEEFALEGERGYAVVLPAEGRRMGGALPGPRIVPTLAEGTVQVRVVDAFSNPVENQAVQVTKKTAAGESSNWSARTDARGLAKIEGVAVQQDALYFVEARYDGAPYQSSFFGMDRRGGIEVALRVLETTSDRSVVRSALRMDVQELENDAAQVVHVYEAMVQGDKAFWDPDLKIEAMEDAKGFTVLRPAEEWLAHEEKAPFATLAGPLPPGEVINLSFGYIVEHDGTVQVDWKPPFDAVQFDVLVDEDFELQASGAQESKDPSPIPERKVFVLPSVSRGNAAEFSLSGLRVRDPIYVRIAAFGAFFIMAASFIAMAVTPLSSNADRLRARRDQLLVRLEEHARAGGSAAERERMLGTLDRIYRQLRALGVDPATDEIDENLPNPDVGKRLDDSSTVWFWVALLGMVIGLGLVTGPLSTIMGGRLREAYRRNRQDPSPKATAAWVIGIVNTVLVLGGLLLVWLLFDAGMSLSP